jgi:soluble lytic murein transglycosylase
LKKLLKRYARTDNPLPYALADYNAGRGNVLKWNSGSAATNSAAFVEQIGFPGTKDYVKAVMGRYAHYRPVFRPDTP